MALEGTAKTIVDILLVIFLPPLAVFLVREKGGLKKKQFGKHTGTCALRAPSPAPTLTV